MSLYDKLRLVHRRAFRRKQFVEALFSPRRITMEDKPLWWQRPKKELEEKFSTLEEQVKWLTVEQEQKVWTNSLWEVPCVTFAIPSEPNMWGVKMADTDATATSQDNSEEGVKANIKQTIDHLLNHRVTPVQRRDLRRATDQAERTSSSGDAAIGRITSK